MAAAEQALKVDPSNSVNAHGTANMWNVLWGGSASVIAKVARVDDNNPDTAQSQSISWSGQFLNPCGKLEYSSGTAPGVVTPYDAGLAFSLTTVESSSCNGGISLPYPFHLDGAMEGYSWAQLTGPTAGTDGYHVGTSFGGTGMSGAMSNWGGREDTPMIGDSTIIATFDSSLTIGP